MCAGNIEDETRWTIEGIKRILALDGADLSDVVKVTVYLEDARNFGRYNKVFADTSRTGGSAGPRSRRAPSSSARSKWTQSRTNRDADS
jgi:enamine deaminase RidA (YjgF/YER057c/UK114 family)